MNRFFFAGRPETNNADETQTNGDVKVNGTDSDSHAPVTSQKYSQILGDHHTNSSTQQFSRSSSSHHIYKSRGFNNKENNNFYNQRTGARSGAHQKSWQRGGNYRTSFKKSDEGEKTGDAKVDSTAEPIKFNEGKCSPEKSFRKEFFLLQLTSTCENCCATEKCEIFLCRMHDFNCSLSPPDEYTRITTPRQDVLFKKGYLSRMNNKTATNLSATVNSTESTAASSTITTSDPDSSVSTLSPATTPSMDFGQVDSLDYAPMYYPGYYDENGMLVIRECSKYSTFSIQLKVASFIQQCTTATITIRKMDPLQRRPCSLCLIPINTIHSSWLRAECRRPMATRTPKTRRNRMVQRKTTINMLRIRMWVSVLFF